MVTIKFEGVVYDLDEVDGTWMLEEARDALANASGSLKIFDAGEWKLMLRGQAIEGERQRLSSLGVEAGARLDVVRVKGSNRPPNAKAARSAAADGADRHRPLTLRFDAVIDIDDAPHTLRYHGMRSRLRDDAVEREIAPLPPDYRDDALRAVYAAVDDMLKVDATQRELRVRDRDLVVLITDD